MIAAWSRVRAVWCEPWWPHQHTQRTFRRPSSGSRLTMRRSFSNTSLPCRGQCTVNMNSSSVDPARMTSGRTAHVRKNPAKLSDVPSVQRSKPPGREDRGHLVAALVGANVAAFELGVAHEVFGLDRSEYADPWYRFRVIGACRSSIPVSGGGWSITSPYTLDDLDQAGTIIVPVWPEPFAEAPPDLLDRLRSAHARGARLVSVCTGAFLLAQTGLLDGPPGTTHR